MVEPEKPGRRGRHGRKYSSYSEFEKEVKGNAEFKEYVQEQ